MPSHVEERQSETCDWAVVRTGPDERGRCSLKTMHCLKPMSEPQQEDDHPQNQSEQTRFWCKCQLVTYVWCFFLVCFVFWYRTAKMKRCLCDCKYGIFGGRWSGMVIESSHRRPGQAVMHGWGQLPSGRRLRGAMPIITNHDFGFAHHGAAEARHPQPGLPGVLLRPWRAEDGKWWEETYITVSIAQVLKLNIRNQLGLDIFNGATVSVVKVSVHNRELFKLCKYVFNWPVNTENKSQVDQRFWKQNKLVCFFCQQASSQGLNSW